MRKSTDLVINSQVPQHKVIDLLDAIEKSVKEKEAKEKEARAAKRKLAPAKNPFLSPAQSPKPSSAGPSLAPSPKVPLPTLEPARSTPSPKYLNTPPKQQSGVIIKSSPKSVTQVGAKKSFILIVLNLHLICITFETFVDPEVTLFLSVP